MRFLRKSFGGWPTCSYMTSSRERLSDSRIEAPIAVKNETTLQGGGYGVKWRVLTTQVVEVEVSGTADHHDRESAMISLFTDVGLVAAFIEEIQISVDVVSWESTVTLVVSVVRLRHFDDQIALCTTAAVCSATKSAMVLLLLLANVIVLTVINVRTRHGVCCSEISSQSGNGMSSLKSSQMDYVILALRSFRTYRSRLRRISLIIRQSLLGICIMWIAVNVEKFSA